MKYGTRSEGHASLRLSVPSALPDKMRGDVVELRGLRTHPDHRGNGDATRLMLSTTLDADMWRYFLFIHVEPEDDSPLDKAALANWYHKFGFVTIQADPLLMVRPNVGAMGAMGNG